MQTNFISFDSIPNYDGNFLDIDLLREVRTQVEVSNTLQDMRDSIFKLRQMLKYKKDLFKFCFSESFDDFKKKFLNIEDTLGKEIIIYESMLFSREILFKSDDKYGELFLDGLLSCIEPFFHFGQNIQIQNLARDTLALCVTDFPTTISIEFAFTHFLETDDQEKCNFWNDKINTFLKTYDEVNLSLLVDWAKIIFDIQETLNTQHINEQNFNDVMSLFKQLKNTLSKDSWDCIMEEIKSKYPNSFLNNL